MKNKLSSYFNSKYILIAVSVLCLVFIVTSFFSDKLAAPLKNAVSSVVVPLQKGMNYMGLWVSDSIDNMQDINRLIDENEKLNEKINELTVENNQLRQDSYELDRLRELYQLDDKYPGYEKIGARVIGSSSDNWYTTFMVDKGSDDGIEVDMNVIADGGLVGIVTKVGHNYSVIKTVVEDNNFVSAMLIDSGDTCTVKGDIELLDQGLAHLQYFKSGLTIRNGDKIVTSNISDKYLPGLLIGYAKDVKSDANNLTLSGYLVPAVDFEHLQEVLIITQKKEKSE
ncbi:MAG: rod shape-determining protein MreC [Lachnospira sp.]